MSSSVNQLGVVVLNYLTTERTKQCVASLLSQTYQNMQIVIVNNNGTDDSFWQLAQQYQDVLGVTVIATPHNLGFARGNNYGISYLKSKGIYDVLVINADVMLIDNHFISSLVNYDYPDNCALVGPRIVNREGRNQNLVTLPVFKGLNFFLVRLLKQWIFTYRPFAFRYADGVAPVFASDFSPQHSGPLNLHQGYLHGAAIYFRANYLQAFCGFYPGTFLFGEESILALLCQRFGFGQYYRSDLQVDHWGGAALAASSAALSGNNQVSQKRQVRGLRRQMRTRQWQLLRSAIVLKKLTKKPDAQLSARMQG